MIESEVAARVADEPVSPELALIDPELRERALRREELAPFRQLSRPAATPPTILEVAPAESLPLPALEFRQPPSRVSLEAVVLYAAVRLLGVLAVGTVIALALAALVALFY